LRHDPLSALPRSIGVFEAGEQLGTCLHENAGAVPKNPRGNRRGAGRQEFSAGFVAEIPLSDDRSDDRFGCHQTFDIGQGRQARLVADVADFVGRSGARQFEMAAEGRFGGLQISGDIGAVKDIAGA
jgi:hypothetical protein